MVSAQPEFYRTTPEEQVQRLAELATAALPAWGLSGAVISPVAYRENMTFRLDAAGQAFAFRIHQAHYRTDAQIQGELDLMSYLNKEGIHTPKVVTTIDGAMFKTISVDSVGEARQCDVFEWIDGKPLRETGKSLEMPLEELTSYYREVGRMAAAIHNATERWQRPAGFDRPAWDAEGLFGVGAHLGDYRRLTDIADEQRALLDRIADKVSAALEGFGTQPDRYGLSHCDFLAENIFICEDGLRLLDFDDAGDAWYLFDLCTAVFDLMETPSYEPCLEAILSGYRELRALPGAHLEMIPAFVLARVLSYLGWCARKTHMPQTAWMKPVLLYVAEKYGAEYLKS